MEWETHHVSSKYGVICLFKDDAGKQHAVKFWYEHHKMCYIYPHFYTSKGSLNRFFLGRNVS